MVLNTSKLDLSKEITWSKQQAVPGSSHVTVLIDVTSLCLPEAWLSSCRVDTGQWSVSACLPVGDIWVEDLMTSHDARPSLQQNNTGSQELPAATSVVLCKQGNGGETKADQ